jgi:tetratricopeptide (TPR) repeat protein
VKPIQKKGSPAGLIAVVLGVVAIVLIFVFSGQMRPSTEPPLISSSGDYRETLRKAQALSQPILEKVDAGEEIDDADRVDLRESARLFEGLVAYRPVFAPNQYLLGRIYQALGEDDTALRKLNDCVRSIEADTKDETLRRLDAEARYQATLSLERIGAYREAEIEAKVAVGAYPDNPNFLAALASAQVQLKRLDEARSNLKKALAIDPEHLRSKSLMAFLDRSMPG